MFLSLTTSWDYLAGFWPIGLRRNACDSFCILPPKLLHPVTWSLDATLDHEDGGLTIGRTEWDLRTFPSLKQTCPSLSYTAYSLILYERKIHLHLSFSWSVFFKSPNCYHLILNSLCQILLFRRFQDFWFKIYLMSNYSKCSKIQISLKLCL